MMNFEQTGNTFTATNSIKKVCIERRVHTFYSDRSEWMVYTPEGRLLDDFTSAGPFVNFEAAKRNAEMNVGMKMNWEDF